MIETILYIALVTAGAWIVWYLWFPPKDRRVYQVTFDTQHYLWAVEKVKSFGDWAKITDTSWLIYTKLPLQGVMDIILQGIPEQTKVLVTEVPRASATGLNKEVKNWIEELCH